MRTKQISAAVVRAPEFIARFLANVDRNGECWLWRGAISAQRYGLFPINLVPVLAHRIAWVLEHGEIPDATCVCHRCDTPLCVRPAHLFIGTQTDNTADRHAKGRTARVRGERHSQAVLSDESVRSIRARYAAGESQRALGIEFGLTRSAIGCVVRRQTWSHVE